MIYIQYSIPSQTKLLSAIFSHRMKASSAQEPKTTGSLSVCHHTMCLLLWDYCTGWLHNV